MLNKESIIKKEINEKKKDRRIICMVIDKVKNICENIINHIRTKT